MHVPIYKKGDKQECGNYRTIALISHASKVLLRIIQRRLQEFLIPELPIEQAGFRRGRGKRDHIANLRWMMEKAWEHQRDVTCASSTTCTRRPSIVSTMEYCRWYWGIWEYSTSTPDSVTEKALHQPGSDSQDGVWRDRQHRHCERSATGMYPLTNVIQYLRRKHNERGFGRVGEWNQRRREDGNEPEIRWRYNLMTNINMEGQWSRPLTLETKVKLVKVLVFLIVLYGAETWTMRKHEGRQIDAFELLLWCWRRVLATESIVDGEKDEHNYGSSRTSNRNGHRSQGQRLCTFKRLWARGESRRGRR